MPLYAPLPDAAAALPWEKVRLWDSGMTRVRSGEPLCANGRRSEDGEGEVEGGPEGVAAVGGAGGGVESLRLLLLLLCVVGVAGVDAGSSELWVNSISSSREIFRYGVSEAGVQGLCSCLRPRDELRESVSEPPS